jgi:ATP diphosphatase
MKDISTLLAIMARLRDPEQGCPWDREQTFESLIPHLLEESYEVADAVASGIDDRLCDELGDVLFQVVFFARIAEETGKFDFAAVSNGIADKLTRRHPHVFGDSRIESAAEQTLAWEEHKRVERQASTAMDEVPGVLDGVALGLPALTRAVKLQRRAARVGFDWPDAGSVLDKVIEELDEVREELEDGGDPARLQHEVGDVLLAVSNLARKLGVDPETAAHRANRRFERRFHRLETLCREQGLTPEACSLDSLEGFWQQAKSEGL